METQKKPKYESIVTPEFRVSYPALFSPQLPLGETDEKKGVYTITMLFQPGTDITPLKTLARKACITKWGPDQNKWPAFKHPLFRSGGEADKKDKPGYGLGVVFCAAKAYAFDRKTGQKRNPPGVIGPTKQIIISPEEVYGGCYGYAKINAYTYDNAFGKGVSFGLISFMKSRDGEAFGRKNDPTTDFDAIEAAPTDSAAEETGAADGGLGF